MLKILRAADLSGGILGVWIADETLSRVFDTSSQSKQKLRSKRRNEIVKILCHLRPGIQTSFAIMIFFVLTRCTINEFEKCISSLSVCRSRRSAIFRPAFPASCEKNRSGF